MAHIGLTGASGHVGRYLADHFANAGHQITLFARTAPANPSSALRAAELVPMDLSDAKVVEKALAARPPEVLIHCAAATQRHFLDMPQDELARLFEKVNVEGSRQLFHAAFRAGTRAVIFTSSLAVYGASEAPGTGRTEEETPCPFSDYGRSKLTAERALTDMARRVSRTGLSLRLGNVPGADQFTTACRRVLRGDQASVFLGRGYPTTDGTLVRDYVHLDDLGRLIEAAIASTQDVPLATAVNACSDQPHSFAALLGEFERQSALTIPVTEEEGQPNPESMQRGSMARARALFGFTPARASLTEIVSHALSFDG